MSSLDTIRIVSDALTAINTRLADTLPGKEFDTLAMKRDEVRAKLDFLTRTFFTDTAQRFVEDSDALVEAATEMRSALEGLENLRTTLESVNRFVKALDTLVEAVADSLPI